MLASSPSTTVGAASTPPPMARVVTVAPTMSAVSRGRPKNGRIPDSHVRSTARASLTTAPCSKTRPTIIVPIAGSAGGFRDTNRGQHPAGQVFRFR